MIWIIGVDPDGMIIYVFVDLADIGYRFTTIITQFIIGICDVYFIGIVGITSDLIVIIAGSKYSTSFLPTCTFVGGTVYTPFAITGFNNCIYHVRVDWTDIYAYSSYISAW